MTDAPPRRRALRHDGELDLRATCGALCEGRSDPTWQVGRSRVARAMHTPDGPATLEVAVAAPGRLEARAWGPGAVAALGAAPASVGLLDHRRGFRPWLHPLVDRLDRHHPGLRVAAAASLWDAAVPVVLGQRVTGREARRSWRALVLRHGAPAPGPADRPAGDPDALWLAPGPGVVARLGDADWHVLGVERRRADAVRGLARVLPALERAARVGTAELERVLRTVPGVGPWTATALSARVLGDPDVVLLGDLHVPHQVCHALTGEPRGSDERMLELLEPWRGHRGRVVALLGRAGPAPRRGPRYSPLPIARW